jgi:Chromo (CHRromatin Organisation MOdifier) domain
LKTIKLHPIQKKLKGVAWHEELEDESSQKDCTKMRRTFWNWWSPWTSLKLPNSWKIHNIFYAALLRPYVKNEVYGNNYPRLLPELLEGQEVYKVETILKHQQRERGYQYHVKWKGYLITKATWDNESAFSDDGDMLEQYKNWYQPQELIGQYDKEDQEQRRRKDKKKIEIPHSYRITIEQNDYPTATSAQTSLSIIKDEFAEVITEGTLSPANKPSDWNIVITKKAILDTMRMPSPPPEEIQWGLATSYDTVFPSAEEY